MRTVANPSGQKDQILIIRDARVTHEAISRCFTNAGYPVTVFQEDTQDVELENYGAIVHVAYSNSMLNERLRGEVNQIKDEEWVLMAGEDEEDLHCTVELTSNATVTLRSFVRTLWSICNIT